MFVSAGPREGLSLQDYWKSHTPGCEMTQSWLESVSAKPRFFAKSLA